MDELEITKGRIFDQEVLPETIVAAIEESNEAFTPELAKALKEIKWRAREYRDRPGLPDFNVIYPENSDESLALVNMVAERMRKMASFLGYEKEDLVPVTLVIDPVEELYKGDSRGRKSSRIPAFYDPRNRYLWIKTSGEGLGLDHEIAHCQTMGVVGWEEKPGRRMRLAIEGFATWAAWQVKSEEEKERYGAEDYHDFPFDIDSTADFSLNTRFSHAAAGVFGALLFEILYERVGDEIESLNEIWGNIEGKTSIFEWLRASFSAKAVKEIEDDWKERIKFQNQSLEEARQRGQEKFSLALKELARRPWMRRMASPKVL